MKKLFLISFFFVNILIANNLDSLLNEYENTTSKSLRTVDEKLGHVVVYSQKEIQLMQYNKLSDILKELPNMNLNRSNFGNYSPLIIGSKTTTGFFRFFINDHEMSSIYNQALSFSWGDLPLDFVDYIEVYYGESSFALGNETGVYFIRIYTKSAKRENANEIKSLVSNKGSNSQSITHSQTLANGWSYLLFLNNEKTKNEAIYNSNEINNDEDTKHFFLDLSNENTKINLGYGIIDKDNYTGLALDVQSDSGSLKSEDFFIDFTQYFLSDKSLKLNLSYDRNEIKYEETNAEGLGLISYIDFTNFPNTLATEINQNFVMYKTTASLSKSFYYGNHGILTSINLKKKKYDIKEISTVNVFGTNTNINQYNNFNEKNVYSFLFQDNYKLNDKLTLVANAKLDKYKRNGYLDDFSEELYRVGAIYTPFENLGFKAFYTKTYLPPSFYNIDFADKNDIDLESQKYKYYTVEVVYTTENSKFGLVYNNVKIDNFMYLSPVGFMNIDHTIKTQGYNFNYEYNFKDNNKLHLNYYITNQNDTTSNYQNGGYAKYMGTYKNFEYFSSLIYREGFNYYGLELKDSFDLSIGATYNFSKDLSFSIKGTNLLDKSTQSIYTIPLSNVSYALDNYDRSVSLSIKWVF